MIELWLMGIDWCMIYCELWLMHDDYSLFIIDGNWGLTTSLLLMTIDAWLWLMIEYRWILTIVEGYWPFLVILHYSFFSIIDVWAIVIGPCGEDVARLVKDSNTFGIGPIPLIRNTTEMVPNVSAWNVKFPHNSHGLVRVFLTPQGEGMHQSFCDEKSIHNSHAQRGE